MIEKNPLQAFEQLAARAAIAVARQGHTQVAKSQVHRDLTIDAPRISRNGLALDGNNAGTAGGNFNFGADPNGNYRATDNFFRFFSDSDGDSDGNRDVDGFDMGQFSRRFRKSLP